MPQVGELAEAWLASPAAKCLLEVRAEALQLLFQDDPNETEEHLDRLDHRHPEEVALQLFLPEAPQVAHLYQQAVPFGLVEGTDWCPK